MGRLDASKGAKNALPGSPDLICGANDTTGVSFGDRKANLRHLRLSFVMLAGYIPRSSLFTCLCISPFRANQNTHFTQNAQIERERSIGKTALAGVRQFPLSLPADFHSFPVDFRSFVREAACQTMPNEGFCSLKKA